MSITESPAWKALQTHTADLLSVNLRDLVQDNDRRFEEFSLSHSSLLIDFSKQRINQKTLELLESLTIECHVSDWIGRLFAGESINNTEDKPALHFALRMPAESIFKYSNTNLLDDVNSNLSKMDKFVSRIHAGQWRGYSGLPIKSIVNIGVGGSDLGPIMACNALTDAQLPAGRKLNIHFVSSMDGSQIDNLLNTLNPATTLFIISSKSFTTVDTLSNANTARDWLKKASNVDLTTLNRRHFIGISANSEKMTEWGIPVNSQLDMWQSVGGRYSMWSATGLPIALRIGISKFKMMLAGAHDMDQHFKNAPFRSNLPMLLGMIGIWNVNFLEIHAHAILPYDGRLSTLPTYLGQLEMESNGKSVKRGGNPVDYATCPILWGEIGPNAQHAFYQLLHQGTEKVMCDFIISARRVYRDNSQALRHQHKLSIANCLAQSCILAFGSTTKHHEEGTSRHKLYRGNQPSTTIVMDELEPYSLGQLIALYEHKVFVQSVVWGINPFDQWGVELGKELANKLINHSDNYSTNGQVDPATRGLLASIKTRQEISS